MSLERKTEIIPEEIEDNDTISDEGDFLYPQEGYDEDDESYEREYCD